MDIHAYRDLLIIWVLELARTGCANLHPGIKISMLSGCGCICRQTVMPSNLREGVTVAAYLQQARHSELSPTISDLLQVKHQVACMCVTAGPA